MTPKEVAHKKIVAYVVKHPEMTYKAVSAKLGISVTTINKILRLANYRRYTSVASLDLDALEGR